MNKNWVIKAPGSEEAIASLASEVGIDRPLAQLLTQRNIHTYQEAKDFFRPDLANLHDPFLMKDMDVAIQRIQEAIQADEKVMVYGDYDVDGTTAVALVYSYFKDRFKDIDYYIPDRYDEGYGISIKGIDYAAQHGFSLIIALDCGIKAVDKIKYASKKGVEFIICDHHNPGAEIPDAVAVLDAKQEGCNYPFKDLSGCGVGLKLVQAYGIKAGLDANKIYDYLDLVVVSIASDIVPITGENRIMAHFGLKKLNDDPSIGLKAIKEVAGIDRKGITIEDIVFKMGPRINAAGRMESGKKSVDLLVCEKATDAQVMGKRIDNFNLDRRNIDTEITRQAIDMIQSNESLKERNSTVLYNAEWHKGVIGIVASRLLDHFYKPTVILTKSNGLITGSARSVNGFDLYNAIESCSDLLENFGGHMYAAGLTMKKENIPLFRQRFEEVVSKTILDDQLIPRIEMDMEFNLEDISEDFYNILDKFQPFGPGNMSPLFVSRNICDSGNGRAVGSTGEHLKLELIEKDKSVKAVSAIAFNMSNHLGHIKEGKPFDVCYSIEMNEFRGESNLQLNVKDIKEK